MTGSVAEERIRSKAEAMMRARWPAARIIHELQLVQGGVRIDLAAITEDHIALAEIKSERDTLKRLPKQLRRAVEVAGEAWVCIAEKHEQAVCDLRRPWTNTAPDAEQTASDLYRVRVMVERGSDGPIEPNWMGHPMRTVPSPVAMFELLWREEMIAALRPLLGCADGPRIAMTSCAVEQLTGQQIRRAVCAQLRLRTFPRADIVEAIAA